MITQTKSTETTKRKNRSKNNSTSSQDGETLEDVLNHLSGLPKPPKNMYESVTGHARIQADGFVKNLEKNIRLPIPIHEKRRVKLEKDEDYVAAQYVKLENSEYVIAQAPNKQNHRDIWRIVWQDQIKVMVSLTNDDQFGEDDKKCYPYFQIENGSSKEIELKKGKFIIACKSKETLSMGVTKYEFEMTASEIEDENEAAAGKMLPITLYHMNSWNGAGQKPESGEPFEMAQNVALLCKEIFKMEVAVLRRSMENFVPPVFIQSFDGIYRSAILWVNLMLLKDVEKRECFDVPELIKKIMKMRPGSLSTYYSFCFTIAVSLHIGKESNWLDESELNSKLGELTKGFNDRKLNDQGVPI
ncbi:unnamed protein product [Caenorhabditis angaria]|uniref:Tyrosine-protein phosphatase domain-containing protein n=1 Tax=Caenorhabditis angaria TaxID=860376 RepID=A0A9P1ITV4_9PELO|nr:unnamed protein product [Caenorhabditis angaria]